MPLRRVALVMAMAAEVGPLKAALAARPAAPPPWAEPLPVEVATATAGGLEVRLVVNGVDPRTGVDRIGTDAAALSTLVALAPPRPDLVMSVGTAGGWESRGSAVGDVVVAWDRVVFHDRRIDLPGFDAYGRGDLPVADLRGPAAAVGCRVGVVSTGDSLDASAEDHRRMDAAAAAAKEMEAAAVARVAALHEIPASAVKAVTDLVDHPAPARQFTANLAGAVERMATVVPELLARLDGTELPDR